MCNNGKFGLDGVAVRAEAFPLVLLQGHGGGSIPTILTLTSQTLVLSYNGCWLKQERIRIPC